MIEEVEVTKTPAEWLAHFKAKGAPVDPFMHGGAGPFNRWYPNTELTEAQYLAGLEAVKNGLHIGGHPSRNER